MKEKRFKRFKPGELVWAHPHARLEGTTYGNWYTGIVLDHRQDNGIPIGWVDVLISTGTMAAIVTLPERAILIHKPTRRDLKEQDKITY